MEEGDAKELVSESGSTDELALMFLPLLGLRDPLPLLLPGEAATETPTSASPAGLNSNSRALSRTDGTLSSSCSVEWTRGT